MTTLTTIEQLAARARLVLYWADWFYNHTNGYHDSKEDRPVGVALAYLWPAMLKGDQIEVTNEDEIYKILLREKVSKDSEIWKFIDVSFEFCEHCTKELNDENYVTYAELPWDITSASKGESGIVCLACDDALGGEKDTDAVCPTCGGDEKVRLSPGAPMMDCPDCILEQVAPGLKLEDDPATIKLEGESLRPMTDAEFDKQFPGFDNLCEDIETEGKKRRSHLRENPAALPKATNPLAGEMPMPLDAPLVPPPGGVWGLNDQGELRRVDKEDPKAELSMWGPCELHKIGEFRRIEINEKPEFHSISLVNEEQLVDKTCRIVRGDQLMKQMGSAAITQALQAKAYTQAIDELRTRVPEVKASRIHDSIAMEFSKDIPLEKLELAYDILAKYIELPFLPSRADLLRRFQEPNRQGESHSLESAKELSDGFVRSFIADMVGKMSPEARLKTLSEIESKQCAVSMGCAVAEEPPPSTNYEGTSEWLALMERGWDHFSNPFEIQALDASNRFTGPDRDTRAKEAHRTECGCGWPEVDYQDAMRSWMEDIPNEGLVPMVVALDKIIENRTDLGDSLEWALQTCKEAIEQVSTMSMPIPARGKTLGSLKPVQNILTTLVEKKKAGTLNPNQFGDAEFFHECQKCSKPFIPDEEPAPGVRICCPVCQGAVIPLSFTVQKPQEGDRLLDENDVKEAFDNSLPQETIALWKTVECYKCGQLKNINILNNNPPICGSCRE